MRHIRRLPVLVLLVVTVVLAPASPATAATPEITVDAVERVGRVEIAISGTVTCSEPTGEAAVRFWATNPHPIEVAQGIGTATVACDDGPVPWIATASSTIIVFDPAFPLLVVASFRRDGVVEAVQLQQFQPGWG